MGYEIVECQLPFEYIGDDRERTGPSVVHVVTVRAKDATTPCRSAPIL